MMRRLVGLSVAVALAIACGKKDSATGGIDSAALVSATYTSISANILTPGCVSCHGGSGGFSFDSYSNTMAAVSPGNAAASQLYIQLASGAMPQSGTKPSATQIQAVADWINAGAANN